MISKMSKLTLVLLITIQSLVVIVNSQNTIPLTLSLFDQHPSLNPNFQPAHFTDGSLGMYQSTLNPVTKLPLLTSQNPNINPNYDGGMTPSRFGTFFTPDYANNTNWLIPITITLVKNSQGFYEYNATDPGFFPINNQGWDSVKDSAGKLVYSRYKDWANNYENFHFCLKMNTYFNYTVRDPPMKFNFLGDDDVILYINNILALDIGGLHAAKAGSVTFDAATVQKLGLVANTIYPFDFYYCERNTDRSNMMFQINYPLDCTNKDYCGVCNGGGDCCNARNCTKFAGNKCKVGTCPPWNTNVPLPIADNISNYCTYTDVSYANMNNMCFNYLCDPATGSAVVDQSFKPCATPGNCQKLKSCINSTGCVFENTCVAQDMCHTASCSTGTCVQTPINCNKGDVCKTYGCNPSVGCTIADKCPTTINGTNGLVNPCQKGFCNTTGGCYTVTEANCDKCTNTPNKCEIYGTCNANTGIWSFLPRPEIDDGNWCTNDTCNKSTGAISHIPISCSGCTYCDSALGKHECTNGASNSCDQSNKCLAATCAIDGSCSYNNVTCTQPADKCKSMSCSSTNGCVESDVVCPDEGLCQVGYCDSAYGCLLKPRVCETAAFCLTGICDVRLGCLSLNRECPASRPNCQYGTCNNVTAACEMHDYDPYPFACRTGAVISVGVAAGVAVAGAVAVGIAVFGGKKGYDYWKESKNNKIAMSSSNPLYETKPTSGENPLFNAPSDL